MIEGLQLAIENLSLELNRFISNYSYDSDMDYYLGYTDAIEDMISMLSAVKKKAEEKL